MHCHVHTILSWLKGHYAYLGRQDTINIARDYLDDLRITGKHTHKTEET